MNGALYIVSPATSFKFAVLILAAIFEMSLADAMVFTRALFSREDEISFCSFSLDFWTFGGLFGLLAGFLDFWRAF
jgi:hypothetical protein